MKSRLDYNRDGKVDTLEKARAFSLAMMATEEEKNDDWGDIDEFYTDDEESEEEAEEISVPVYSNPQPKREERNLEREYQDAVAKMHMARTGLEYQSCATRFCLLKGYKDSKELYEYCYRIWLDDLHKTCRCGNWLDALFWIVLFIVICFVVVLLALCG